MSTLLTKFKTALNPKKAMDKNDYFENAQCWSADIYTHSVVWKNWCILIALFSLSLVMVALVLLLKLLPLKENTPFLVFVDQENGLPVTIKPVNTPELIENAQLKKYMIRKFIHARERFNPVTINEDLQAVTVMASPQVVKEYYYAVSSNNPLSPSNRYKNVLIDPSDISITFLNDQRAYVSFKMNINQDGIYQSIPAHADIKFQFAERYLPELEAQAINPVNFEVLTYQSHHSTTSKETL